MKVVSINGPQDIESLMAQLFGQNEREETHSEKVLNELMEKTHNQWEEAHGELKAMAMMAFVRGQAMAIHCSHKHKDANLSQRGEVGEGLKHLLQIAWLSAEGLAGEEIWNDIPWNAEQQASLSALGEIIGPVVREMILLLNQIDAEIKEEEARQEASTQSEAGDPADSHPV